MIIKGIKEVSKAFLLSRILLVFWILIIFNMNVPLVEANYLGVEGVLNPLTAYDSEHYLNIAEFGYTREHLYAFFPLYSILIYLLSLFKIPFAWGGVIVSWVSSFSFTYLLYKIVPEDNKKKAIYLWCLSPILIYSAAVYTESLFLFLTLGGWYFYKKDKYLLSGIMIGLSILTRNTGSFLLLIIFIDLIKNKKNIKKMFKVVVPSVVMGSLYPFYLYFTTGNMFKFVYVQSLYGREKAMPWEGIIRDIKLLISGVDFSLVIYFNFIALILAIYLIIKFIKTDTTLCIFLILCIMAPLSAPVMVKGLPSTTSLLRYIFGTFPVYILLSKLNYSKIQKLYGFAGYIILTATFIVIFTIKGFIG